MSALERMVLDQPFFAGLDADIGAVVSACARSREFESETYLFSEGDEALEFFLLLEGHVALEIHAPSRPTLVLGTIHVGDVVGASWLVPPHRWTCDAQARSPVRALGFDAVALRGKCDQDPRTGYAMMKRFAPLLVRRLNTAYLQLLDIYGRPEGEGQLS